MRFIALVLYYLWLLPAPIVAQIDSIGVAGDGVNTRITIAAFQPLAPQVSIEEDGELRRLYLHLESVSLVAQPFLADPAGGVATYSLDPTGITFELSQPLLVARRLDLPPTEGDPRHRLVLDLVGVSEARFSRAAERSPPRPISLGTVLTDKPKADTRTIPITAEAVEQDTIASPSLKPWGLEAVFEARKRETPHIIVIDPGHGGKDPGAISPTGGQEKDIVLATALILQEALSRDPRYDVHMTRETDIYVDHEDRLTKARDWGAELFISIHADAAASDTVMGASVYTINTRGERRIDGTAQKNQWELPIEDGLPDEVNALMEDWIKRETKSNSAIFAETVLPELARAGPLVRNSHRTGNLFVLLAPDVPAVLIEIGFLTNSADAKRLRSKDGRRKSALAIKRGIDAYFDDQEARLSLN